MISSVAPVGVPVDRFLLHWAQGSLRPWLPMLSAKPLTHDFLRRKTGSVAPTEDASRPRRYPR